MAVKLNTRALEHARELIGYRRVVPDERNAWSEPQPSLNCLLSEADTA
jgi:hypothetical protein